VQKRQIVHTIAASKIEQDQRHEDLGIAPALGTPPHAHMPSDRGLQPADRGQFQVGRESRQRGHPAPVFLGFILEREHALCHTLLHLVGAALG
jgi:hypothetical protein